MSCSWIRTLECALFLLAGATLIAAKARQSAGVKTPMKTAIQRLSNYPKRNVGVAPLPGRRSKSASSSDLSSEKYPLALLKRSLMDGYDKDLRPVHNDSDIIEVEVDIIYRQVLDMDEKNQILTSLVWYRKHWQDMHLKWSPDEQGDLKELWLPAEAVWKPDIVLQEETGVKDFSPRLPFVKVNFDGHIEYQEPVTFTTSCSMNTMHFPFDVQHCNLTFSSWSHPGHKISLKPERTTKQMANDDRAFVNTGEWNLEYMDVIERRANYSGLFAESKSEYIDWPEVVFTVTLRRNSYFYIQSLIFPRLIHSVLLTTIALFGFLLPASSGERVGLQITILLTFMVFLLTVCEMFPASNGPYLGYYYVICIFLLSVNLLMTVLVLQLYHHPHTPVYRWLKTLVVTIGKCCKVDVSSLKEKSANDGASKISERRRSTRSCLCNVMLSCLKELEPGSDEEAEAGRVSCEILDTANHDLRSLGGEWQQKYTSPVKGRQPFEETTSASHLCKHCDSRKITRIRTCEATAYCKKRTTVKSAHRPACRDHRNENLNSRSNITGTVRNHQFAPQDHENIIKTESAWQKSVASEVDRLLRTARQLIKDGSEEENDWKKMALILDKIFLRLYSTMLALSHVIIVATAYVTSSTIEPHVKHSAK